MAQADYHCGVTSSSSGIQSGPVAGAQECADRRPSLQDRYAGALLGAALGDALGRPVEFLDEDVIRYRFGPAGILEPPSPALYTDDTQLMMATARALLHADTSVPGVVRGARDEYLAWLATQDSPVHRRAPGVSIIGALQRLQRGLSPSVAADAGANESIVATRVLPVAMRFHGDLGRIVSTATELSRLTHSHPGAVAGGAAAALFLEYALAGRPTDTWFRKGVIQLKRWCPDDTRQAVESLRAAESAIEWSDDDAVEAIGRARPSFGAGWTADEAVALGLWCFLRHQGDYKAAVRLAANAVGESDSDAIATVAGALAGACLGAGAIPIGWLDRLEDRDTIAGLADALYSAAGASDG